MVKHCNSLLGIEDNLPYFGQFTVLEMFWGSVNNKVWGFVDGKTLRFSLQEYFQASCSKSSKYSFGVSVDEDMSRGLKVQLVIYQMQFI